MKEKMDIQKLLSLFCLMLLMGACQEDLVLDVNLPEAEEQLVVNSVFSPDSLFEVYLNNSVALLGEESPRTITNATVELLEGDQIIDVLTYDQSLGIFGPFVGEFNDFAGRSVARYKSDNLMPELGKEYTVRVRAEGFDEVTGSGHVPENVPIATTEYIPNTISNELGTRGEIRISFDDPANEVNYYNLRHHYRTIDINTNYVYSYTSGFNLITPLQDDLFGADPDDLIGGNDTFSASDDGVTFSDALFDGTRKEIVIDVADDICGAPSGFPELQCQQVVELSTVTEAFYNYHRTLQLQNAATQNPFAEPVRIKSNMSNDLGVFAGINKSVWIYVQN